VSCLRHANADHAGERVELSRLMPLLRALEQVGMRTTAVGLIELVRRPGRVGDSVVRKCEYELRRYLRREPADLERAVAGLILLALRNLDGSVAP
jgi:hypothetical protein